MIQQQALHRHLRYTYYYGVDSNNPNEPDWGTMLGGSEVYDGVERLYGADWASLGQKSNVDLAAAVNDTAVVWCFCTTAAEGCPSEFVGCDKVRLTLKLRICLVVMVTQRRLITTLMAQFLDMRWRRAGLMMTRRAQRRPVQTPAIMMRELELAWW